MDSLVTAAAELWRAVETPGDLRLDDVERTVARTAILARHALGTGELRDLAEEVLGRASEVSELDALAAFLAELEKEGL